MGKKSGRNGGGKEAAAKATAFVLKVPMHCRCHGCDDKIRAAVKDLTLNHGIEALDQSALWTKGELRVASTADPDKLRRRLHKATGKNVGLVILKPQPPAADKAAEKDAAAAAAVEELLHRSLQQQGQYAHAQAAAWPNNQVLHGAAWSAFQQHQPGGYGYAAAAPWAVQVQQPEAYPSFHHPAAYPATGGAWGAYAYPPSAPAQLGHGAYGGGWPY